MAELLASATTEATSTDFAVTAGTPVTLFLKTATTDTLPSDGWAVVQIKSAGGAYYTVGDLKVTNSTYARILDGAGTYRVKKFATASGTAYGVDKE